MNSIFKPIIFFFLLMVLIINSCKQNEDLAHINALAEDESNVEVIVDFSLISPTVKSMSGFLHGMTNTYPNDSIIAPLNPRFFRGGVQMPIINERVKKFKATPIFAIDEVFMQNYLERKMPWEDYEAWDLAIRNLLLTTQEETYIYDIFNEPNSPQFFTGTQTQFFKSFKVAHDAIRSVMGNKAIISGPSIDRWDEKYIESFLNYCLKHQLTLDVLSWHEFRVKDIGGIQSALVTARKKFLNNPLYQSLGIKEIHINEYLDLTQINDPASILAYLFHLEKGGADGACKSNWLPGYSLSNTVSINDNLPLSAWWVYKYYNEGIEGRVSSITSTNKVISFASRTLNKSSNIILIGNYDIDHKIIPHCTVELRNLALISAHSNIKISVYVIPWTADAMPIKSLELVQEHKINYLEGNIKVFINPLKYKSVYLLIIE